MEFAENGLLLSRCGSVKWLFSQCRQITEWPIVSWWSKLLSSAGHEAEKEGLSRRHERSRWIDLASYCTYAIYTYSSQTQKMPTQNGKGVTATFLLDQTQLVSRGTQRIDVRFLVICWSADPKVFHVVDPKNRQAVVGCGWKVLNQHAISRTFARVVVSSKLGDVALHLESEEPFSSQLSDRRIWISLEKRSLPFTPASQLLSEVTLFRFTFHQQPTNKMAVSVLKSIEQTIMWKDRKEGTVRFVSVGVEFNPNFNRRRFPLPNPTIGMHSNDFRSSVFMQFNNSTSSPATHIPVSSLSIAWFE